VERFDGSSVVFGHEGDFAGTNASDALIGDGYSMGVLPQVTHHMIDGSQ